MNTQTPIQYEVYKDYLLKPVFDYSNGKRDWQVYRVDADYGSIVPYKTLQEVKEYVDEQNP